MARQDDIRQLISIHKRRLQKLKEQPEADPAILMEIEDIETEMQRYQTLLEDKTYKNRTEIESIVRNLKRRLQLLKEKQTSAKQTIHKEIANIEAEIRGLETELERLGN